MDIIFFIFVPGSWMTYEENNHVWNNLRGMHGFAIFLSVIIFILKVNLPSLRSPFFILSFDIRSNWKQIESNDKLIFYCTITITDYLYSLFFTFLLFFFTPLFFAPVYITLCKFMRAVMLKLAFSFFSDFLLLPTFFFLPFLQFCPLDLLDCRNYDI